MCYALYIVYAMRLVVSSHCLLKSKTGTIKIQIITLWSDTVVFLSILLIRTKDMLLYFSINTFANIMRTDIKYIYC